MIVMIILINNNNNNHHRKLSKLVGSNLSPLALFSSLPPRFLVTAAPGTIQVLGRASGKENWALNGESPGKNKQKNMYIGTGWGCLVNPQGDFILKGKWTAEFLKGEFLLLKDLDMWQNYMKGRLVTGDHKFLYTSSHYSSFSEHI